MNWKGDGSVQPRTVTKTLFKLAAHTFEFFNER